MNKQNLMHDKVYLMSKILKIEISMDRLQSKDNKSRDDKKQLIAGKKILNKLNNELQVIKKNMEKLTF